MPSIQFYSTFEDVKRISNWLVAEPNIALIESVGSGKWKAKHFFEINSVGRKCLFHDQCGPLPLLNSDSDSVGVVADPFEGWTENRAGADKTTPYFGSGHTGIFWFNVRSNETRQLAVSSFEWIGNHYSVLGRMAPVEAKRWWHRLKRYTTKDCVKVDNQGKITLAKSPYWATPDAEKLIKIGIIKEMSREDRRKCGIYIFDKPNV